MIRTCPLCNRNEGAEHPLDYTGGMMTCMGFIPQQDTDGHYHHHDGNEMSGEFTCRNGCSGRFLDREEEFLLEYDKEGVGPGSPYKERFGGIVFSLPPTTRCWCGWPTVDAMTEFVEQGFDIAIEQSGVAIVNAKALRVLQGASDE